jgi:hypothetical protein
MHRVHFTRLILIMKPSVSSFKRNKTNDDTSNNNPLFHGFFTKLFHNSFQDKLSQLISIINLQTQCNSIHWALIMVGSGHIRQNMPRNERRGFLLHLFALSFPLCIFEWRLDLYQGDNNAF